MAERAINAKFVDHNGVKYRPGDEEKLAKVLPKRDIDVFVEKGILTGDWSEAGELPPIKDLQDYLAGVESADEVHALQARDDRKGAAALYDARIAEIEEQ